jgi:hypothetical protein
LRKPTFRTNSDAGANTNALHVWNALRNFAGYPDLTEDDLRMRQVNSSGGRTTLEDLRAFDKMRAEERYARYRNSLHK